MPDISIIIPVYNTSKYLNKCLDSIINQTKKELEFIIINDGSTDNSEDIIKEYKDKRIKYYKNKNQGIGKTRNYGIDKSNGKYIMFLDSDDYLELNACEELYKKIEKDNLDILVFDVTKIYDNKKEEDIITNFKNTSLKDNPKLLNIINLGPCNKIYKTSLLKNNNIRFEENLKYEDASFIAISLDKANLIGKYNKCLYNYVIHSNSETTTRDNKVFDIIKIIDVIRDYYKDKNYIKEELDKLTVRMLTNYTIQQRNQKDIKTGIKFINEAFTYLNKNIPNYKNNKYFEGRGIIRRTIEKSKSLTIAYIRLYKLFHK